MCILTCRWIQLIVLRGEIGSLLSISSLLLLTRLLLGQKRISGLFSFASRWRGVLHLLFVRSCESARGGRCSWRLGLGSDLNLIGATG